MGSRKNRISAPVRMGTDFKEALLG